MMKSKVLLVISSVMMSVVLATSASLAATVSDEELNAALDARLKASGVALNNIEGMSLNEQVAAKKTWYNAIYSQVSTVTMTDDGPKVSAAELNAAYDTRLNFFGVTLNTEGMTLSEQIAAKNKAYEQFLLNKSYDSNLDLLGIEVDTNGMTLEEQTDVKQRTLATWYEHI
jgi:hypothetical protein